MITKTLLDGNGNPFDIEINDQVDEQSDANSKSVVLSTGSKALFGATNETAPGTDTAAAGLNGRLQRIAQRLTSLIALLPTSLGTKTAANSLPVTLASDGQLVTTTGAVTDAAYGGSGSGTIVSILKWIGASLASLVATAGSAATQNFNLGTEALSKSDGTQLTPKFAKIDASTNGAGNVLVAAVTGKKIRVLSYKLTGAGAVNAKFTSDPAGTPADLTGLTYIPAAGGGEAVGFSPVGHFETAVGKALGMNLSAAVNVAGFLTYIEVA